MMNKIDVSERTEEMQKKISRIETLGTIYNYIVEKMQWDLMKYHSSDDEHDSTWFTEYDEEEDPWGYERMTRDMPVYEEVLEAIEKLMK